MKSQLISLFWKYFVEEIEAIQIFPQKTNSKMPLIIAYYICILKTLTMVLLAFLMLTWWAKIIHANAGLTLPSWQDFFFFWLQRLKRHVHIVRYRGERKGWIKENLWVEMMIHLHLSPVSTNPILNHHIDFYMTFSFTKILIKPSRSLYQIYLIDHQPAFDHNYMQKITRPAKILGGSCNLALTCPLPFLVRTALYINVNVG